MRTLALILVVLTWGIAANAQPQASAQSTTPPAANGYSAHPSTKRFFFASNPETTGKPAVFGRPAKAPATSGFLRPYVIASPVSQNRVYPTVTFPLTGLRPLESQPPQDFRRFLKPGNTRLFFFNKP
jgi:hypothetical protein